MNYVEKFADRNPEMAGQKLSGKVKLKNL